MQGFRGSIGVKGPSPMGPQQKRAYPLLGENSRGTLLPVYETKGIMLTLVDWI